MLINNILLLVGSAIVAGSCWPAIKFGMEGPPDLLPENPRPVIGIAQVLLTLYLLALIGAFFSSKIDWWIPIVSFLIAGPFGMGIGVNYIRRRGHFLTLILMGLVGIGFLVSAFIA